jgi:hypothetical protein
MTSRRMSNTCQQLSAVRLQSRRDAFMNVKSSFEPGRDLHDFIAFADRVLASIAHAGRLPRQLRPFVCIDRLDAPAQTSR